MLFMGLVKTYNIDVFMGWKNSGIIDRMKGE